MFSSSTVTIAIALVIAACLVGFGIGRLIKLFHEEFHRENSPEDTPYTLDTANKKQ